MLFIGVIIYVGAHKKIIEALDHRSARIKAELDEARRLRDEAAKLLAEYQRKQREAEREAEAIVADAKAEAERVAAEAHAKMEEFVARRTKLAETKIGQAEAQALADVRAAAAEAAVTRRREDPARHRQGQDRRRPDRPRHRGREGEAELSAVLRGGAIVAVPHQRPPFPCAQPVHNVIRSSGSAFIAVEPVHNPATRINPGTKGGARVSRPIGDLGVYLRLQWRPGGQ